MNLIILSDTQGLLRPEVLELLQTAHAILHAGDINSQAAVDQLAAFAPLYVVRGNNDVGTGTDLSTPAVFSSKENPR